MNFKVSSEAGCKSERGALKGSAQNVCKVVVRGGGMGTRNHNSKQKKRAKVEHALSSDPSIWGIQKTLQSVCRPSVSNTRNKTRKSTPEKGESNAEIA